MAKKARKSEAPAWATALDAHVAGSKKVTWAKIAAKMDRTEGGIRHWRNGTRDIKLTEFAELCAAAGAVPERILAEAAGGPSERESSEDQLPAREGMLLELFRGMTPQQQRENIIKMMATVESNRVVQTFVTKPLRTYSNEEVRAVIGDIPTPQPQRAAKSKSKQEPGDAMGDFLDEV